ncbi:MAG: hemolysin family protein [Eubacteriales bacterium]|nr:hemolysin family protein [Eubacteriales bacterium]
MSTRTMVLYIAAMAVLLMLSAFFSATETAFTSLNRIKIKNLSDSGNDRAKKVLKLSDKYDKLLSTILIGNNIVNIANTAIATIFFVKLFGSYGATISTVVMTIVVLIFGEVSPKNIAKEEPERFAMAAAPAMGILIVVFTPFNAFFSLLRKVLLHFMKHNDDRGITEDELLTMVEEAETEGSIHEDQSELIQNAIEFNELEACDVITPRVDIKAIEINMTEDEVADIFLKTGFSRLPVYDDDLDKILGVLNQKDFHNYIYHKSKTITDMTKPVIYVPETMKISVLLKRMQANKCQIAIVVDEYGGTTGLVAMEDIIEELVGEIYDEHEEVDASDITRMQDGSYRVLGTANLEKMFEYFDVEAEYDSVTVNGWVERLIDKLPSVGDKFRCEVGDKVFTGHVTVADSRKAEEVNIVVTDKPSDDEDK